MWAHLCRPHKDTRRMGAAEVGHPLHSAVVSSVSGVELHTHPAGVSLEEVEGQFNAGREEEKERHKAVQEWRGGDWKRGGEGGEERERGGVGVGARSVGTRDGGGTERREGRGWRHTGDGGCSPHARFESCSTDVSQNAGHVHCSHGHMGARAGDQTE